MPPARPPESGGASLSLLLLEAGTRVWRVHPKGKAATEFLAEPSDDLFGGGRFDGTTADPYPFLYAAREVETALLEVLVRGIPFNQRGERLIRRVKLAGQRISALVVTTPLTLVSLLTTVDLASACQDEWLVQADASDYPQTRRWGSWLRKQADSAQGIVWPSRRNLGHQAVVLFGDRCHCAVELASEPAVDLDDAVGAAWLNERLAGYRIRVRPPAGTP